MAGRIPRSSTHNLVFSGPFRWIIPIRGPFIGITHHIVETVGIGCKLSRVFRSTCAIRLTKIGSSQFLALCRRLPLRLGGKPSSSPITVGSRIYLYPAARLTRDSGGRRRKPNFRSRRARSQRGGLGGQAADLPGLYGTRG